MRYVLTLIVIPLFSVSQLFTIDDDYMELYNISTINNFSENTYVNTLSSVNISYEIITDSMPAAWDFQHCFPECHPINTAFINPISFPADSSIFLKGHSYPNNIAGEGLLIMELEANHGAYLDTVIWRGTAMPETSLKELLSKSKNIKHITDLSGKLIKGIGNENIIITDNNGKSQICYILK